MQFYEVCVLPTKETLDYLRRVTQSSSLTFDFENMYVSLNVSVEDTMKPNPNAFYTATAVSLERVYEPATDATQLVLLFDSPSMTERHLELRGEAPNPLHQSYYPHLKMMDYLPQIRRHHTAQINSYGDTFIRDGFVFTFEGEFPYSYDSDRAPDMALYQLLDTRAMQAISHYTGYTGL